MMATSDKTAVLSPTALVRAAVEALHVQFFEPLAVADLLRDAWEGAPAAQRGPPPGRHGTAAAARHRPERHGAAVPAAAVVLIGPGSISGAESFAGPMQAHGRATLVGERTAGMCGVMRSVRLTPGWVVCLAAAHSDFGPEAWQLNRIGVTPDVVVTPSPEDEAAGRDPQLEAALAVLRNQTAVVGKAAR